MGKGTSKKNGLVEFITRSLPYIGVLVFALCSWPAVCDLLMGEAENPSKLYYLGAAAVEVYSAVIITKVIEFARIATASIGSGMKKERRRFGRIVFGVFVILVTPSVAVSIIANRLEFGNNFWLGVLFPALGIACAGAGVLPAVYEAKVAELGVGGKQEDSTDEPPKAKVKQPKSYAASCSVAGCGYVTAPKPTQRQANKALCGHMVKHKKKDE